MPSLGFRLSTHAAKNETPAALVEHLRCAGPQLLPIEIAIKPDPEKARQVFSLIGQKTPRYFAGLVKQRVQQVPRARGFGLRLPVAVPLHISGDFRRVIPSIRPLELPRHIEVQRLRLEQIAEV